MKITRRLRRKIAAHAAKFDGLPLKTVPSAACSDDTTRAWSAELYAQALSDANLTAPPMGNDPLLDYPPADPLARFQTLLRRGRALTALVQGRVAR